MTASRTAEAVPGQPVPAESPWPEIDRRLLHGSRPPPPSFPLGLLASPWRGWVEAAAQSFTSVDYLAQGLLGAVVALCGGRLLVGVAPHWREPLVLWLALVGGPSTGKTPALALAHGLAERVLARGGATTTLAPELKVDARVEMLARAASHSPGVGLWCDDLAGWLGSLSTGERSLALAGWSAGRAHVRERPGFSSIEVGRFPLSVVATLRADCMTQALAGPDDGPAARFLYAWPVPGLEAGLGGPSQAELPDVAAMLARLVDLVAPRHAPALLPFDSDAVEALQPIVTSLRGFMQGADGLEAAWIGKGPGTIVRLAGLLCLMDWAAEAKTLAPAGVAAAHVERAHALWAEYFWPHAQAVFGQAGTTAADRQARRVALWLRRVRPDTVSREEIRREALCQTVDAEKAEALIERLERYGALRPLAPQGAALGGPRRRRWQVNPELWAG